LLPSYRKFTTRGDIFLKLQQGSTILITRLLAIGVLALIVLSARSADALPSLLGEQVTGVFNITGGSTNLYDPENGLVPDNTYGNSNNSPGNGTNIVPISDTLVEFGYEGTSSMALFTANFTGSGTLTLTATAQPFMAGVTQTFTSTGFTGLNFNPVSIVGSNSCSFGGTTITCITPPGPAGGFTSIYQFSSPAQVPEPASLTLLALGLAGIISRCRKRA
jgi:hypothetical protein